MVKAGFTRPDRLITLPSATCRLATVAVDDRARRVVAGDQRTAGMGGVVHRHALHESKVECVQQLRLQRVRQLLVFADCWRQAVGIVVDLRQPVTIGAAHAVVRMRAVFPAMSLTTCGPKDGSSSAISSPSSQPRFWTELCGKS